MIRAIVWQNYKPGPFYLEKSSGGSHWPEGKGETAWEITPNRTSTTTTIALSSSLSPSYSFALPLPFSLCSDYIRSFSLRRALSPSFLLPYFLSFLFAHLDVFPPPLPPLSLPLFVQTEEARFFNST